MCPKSDYTGTLESLTPSENALLITFFKTGNDEMMPEEVLNAGYHNWKGQVEVMNAASWLKSKGILDIREKVVSTVELDKEGLRYAESELPEGRVLDLYEKGIRSMKELMTSGLDKSQINVGITNLKPLGLEIKKGTLDIPDTKAVRDEIEKRMTALKFIREKGKVAAEEVDPKMLNHLKGRKKVISIREKIQRRLILTEAGRTLLKEHGNELKVVENVGQLKPEDITSGNWRNMNLRKYDINTFAPEMPLGKMHPMSELIKTIKNIFISMGFKEIRGNYVQPAFWNMDALFIPQDHPAREMQDTLYTVNPETIKTNDEELVSKIRAVHENGWTTGSRGWHYNWSREESERALLRTHTTVETIKYLSNNPDPPVKVFSVDRVFRNESVDATHLPEFYQIEGIVMEENASFSMLLGIIKEFYKRMGFTDVRVRPAYFPYTEPSLEVEVKFEDSWLELGGAGMFRPEVTEPHGIRYPVLAWGLGLERLAMLIFDLDDIRDLYMSDLDWLKHAPLTILGK